MGHVVFFIGALLLPINTLKLKKKSFVVNFPTVTLGCANLVHGVLTNNKRSQKSRKGGRGKEPRGGGREATPVEKTVYRRDVYVQNLCVRLRKHAESRGTADAAPHDAQHWPTYVHLNLYLLSLLLDKHAVHSMGSCTYSLSC